MPVFGRTATDKSSEIFLPYFTAGIGNKKFFKDEYIFLKGPYYILMGVGK